MLTFWSEEGIIVPLIGVITTVGVVLCGILFNDGGMTLKLIGELPPLSI
jgi:hypothetical protein